MGPPKKRAFSYANVMSSIAVLLAFGGTSYAATQLSANSVTSRAIQDGAVHARDLANGAVQTAKIADRAVTGPKVANQSLTGSAFRCEPGDFGLENRNFCFFKLTASNGTDWAGAVQMCRARGRTAAVLASPAEIAAMAPGGGSPFKNMTAWTSDVSSGGPNGNGVWVVTTDANGAVGVFISTPITNSVIEDVPCVYHAADVF